MHAFFLKKKHSTNSQHLCNFFCGFQISSYNKMSTYFVGGTKTNPVFLVEISNKKKQITVYKPDIYSKGEDFFEKYVLGEVVMKVKYNQLFLEKNVVSCKKKYKFIPDMMIKVKNKMFLIGNRIEMV